MDPIEHIIEFERHDAQLTTRVLIDEIDALLNDAEDAIRINAYFTALRRVIAARDLVRRYRREDAA